eukprot:2150841-Pyramimonas_sp.AAC.1
MQERAIVAAQTIIKDKETQGRVAALAQKTRSLVTALDQVRLSGAARAGHARLPAPGAAAPCSPRLEASGRQP